MRSEANEQQNRTGFLVDQQQIGADMTIAITLPLAFEGMVQIPLSQREPIRSENLQDRIKQGVDVKLQAGWW